MGFEIEKIFEDAAHLSKIHTKKEYEKQMNVFLEDRYVLLMPLWAGEDTRTAAKQFCDEVITKFKKFGKVRGGDLMTLNYFMIYYIFPSIQLKEESETAIRTCDILKETWNDCLKCNINYTDYNTLMEGFRTKILGIPIGKD